ncbi:MAG TPA: M3 family metallopeptidase [Thermoanaerobaculia bacterium]|jgi:peptidyl-dipeptidase Dcp|nr:M3 family metallopeptidase [Thermoanaerobaculia bacterium]
MTKPRFLALAAILAALVLPTPAARAQLPAANPFAAPSPLFDQAPQFDRIKDTDYLPAFEEGMKVQAAEMTAIADDPAPPTFENTIVAMEKSGELLTRVAKVFFNMDQSNTNDAIQKIKAEVAPRLAAHQDSISLNPKLYARVKALYDRRDALGLDAQGKYLVERDRLGFVRAGAELPEADKAVLTALNQEEAKLTTDFEDKVLADTNAAAVVVEDRKQLAGLSAGDLAAAAQAATERKLDGKWVLALQNTTQQPALGSLTDRALRQRLFDASVRRGKHGGENDTTAIVARLAELRAKKAKLLGFPTYAAYVLDDQMAKTPESAEKLMTDLVPAATAKARGEAARLQKQIDTEKGGFALSAADWELYSEKVRKAEYDLDESEVRPYLDLERVLNDGVFFAANKLYGITFKPRPDLPVYHPDVRVWEVFDADGKSLALYYGDYYQRSSKSGGAWCESFVDQSGLLGTKPVIVNNLNFTKPAPGEKALISFTNATVLFHEFGHALHGMFQNVRYPTLASTPRDFVEFPSQFNEHWALDPVVFANYAKHNATGAPMPDALVAKIKKAKTFNQGYLTTEYLAAALVDMAWHTLPADAPKQDVGAFEKAALERFHVDLVQVPPRYHTTYFSHIWGGGYAAGYYAYLWAEVIDDDAFAWFKENGGLTRANGQRFREMVLSRGGSEPLAAMYRAFRGRDPIVEPLLEDRGLAAPRKP